MNCLIGYRNSERIWLMTVLQQSLGETQSKEVKTLPSHLVNFHWSREEIWNWVFVSIVFLRTSEGPRNALSRIVPRLCIKRGENLELETCWSQTLKNWRRWTHQNSTPEGSMQRMCSRRKEVETSYSQSHLEQSKSLENSV